MGSILLSPHNLGSDDESLFGAYTCLRHRPLVIVLLRSFVEAAWPGPTWQQREPETHAACEILGCQHEQWTYPDSGPPWDEIRERLAQLKPSMVWAPLPEPGGHPHHNAIGELARELFPYVDYYATYTQHAGGATKSTAGTKVQPEADWPVIKRAAMDCYETQANHPATHLPFDTWEIDEYIS